MKSFVKKILILGGGTAGWMTAAMLSRFFNGHPLKIEVIESPVIGSIGVGEATVPTIRQFNELLGIDEKDFIKRTNGSFKLGIEFVDWGYEGNRYFHGFGDFGSSIQGLSTHHHWLSLRGEDFPYPYRDWSFAAFAAQQGKFAPPPTNHLQSIAAYNYAYHFDASLYAEYLRCYALDRGVTLRQDKVIGVTQDPDSGYIMALELESGENAMADFFIDCSGFQGVIISKTLGVPFENWQRWLPCDAAVAIPCRSVSGITPFTSATAKNVGWQWRIPLQHRVGNGRVYASEFADASQAEQQLLSSLEGEPLGEPRHIKFVTGHRKRFWDKNCLAIGLSAGFMEPLESTSIQLIQNAIMRFLEFFPGAQLSKELISEYNRISTNEYERIRDFLIAHYCFNARVEPFWRHCSAIALPDSLQHKMEVYRSMAKISMLSEESYAEFSWISVLFGLKEFPDSHSPLAELIDRDNLRRGLLKRRQDIVDLVDTMPSHEYYLQTIS